VVSHRHAVPAGQPVEQQVGVRLAHAPEHKLVRLGFVLQPERRILGHEPGQGLRHLVLIGLGLRRDRHGEQRLWHRPRLHQQRAARVREGVTGLGARQLGHGADVAGHARGDAALLLAERRGQRADPLVLVVVGVPARGAAVT
jgi:hypothetical protein